jgi:hypothetical protein
MLWVRYPDDGDVDICLPLAHVKASVVEGERVIGPDLGRRREAPLQTMPEVGILGIRGTTYLTFWCTIHLLL